MQMRLAWKRIKTENDKLHPQKTWEGGFAVLYNPLTGQFRVSTIGVQPQDPYHVRIQDPQIPGWLFIGAVHTHFGNGTGTGSGLRPWPWDVKITPQSGQVVLPTLPFCATFNFDHFQTYQPQLYKWVEPEDDLPYLVPVGPPHEIDRPTPR
jgi:hypothetical protein